MSTGRKHNGLIHLVPGILALACAFAFAYTLTVYGIVASLGWLVAIVTLAVWQWTIILLGHANKRCERYQWMVKKYRDALVDARRNNPVADKTFKPNSSHTFDGSKLGAMWADLSDVRRTNGAKMGGDKQ